MSDRDAFRANRDAAKAKLHEKRLEAATYTAAEVKVLTETASKVAYELGRKDALTELAGTPHAVPILVATDLLADLGDWSQPVQVMLNETPGIGAGYEMVVRTLSLASGAVSDEPSGGSA